MTLSYLAHSNLPPNRFVGWSISAFAVQLLVFELKILEIFESEIRQKYPGLSVDAGELSRLQQKIIRPGEEGGIITQTEFMFSKFCTEEKLKKKNLIVSFL